ncbi:MAG: TlpA disulfide reductase family protein [FCB group bacterium]|jgi:thiol-disulfide isomerase/thioredoxin
MNFRILSVATILLIFSLYITTSAKETSKIPSAIVKNLNGQQINTDSLNNNGKPFIINFWATWCMPCIEEMKAFNEVYEDWQNETGVKIISVSIDDSRNSKKVAPFVRGRKWAFEIYLDENSDFKRAMNVNNPPHSFLCNGNGEIVWQHAGYAPGDEENIHTELLNLIASEKEKSNTKTEGTGNPK